MHENLEKQACGCIMGNVIIPICVLFGPLRTVIRQPQLMIVQTLVKRVYSVLITNNCQLQDREYH